MKTRTLKLILLSFSLVLAWTSSNRESPVFLVEIVEFFTFCGHIEDNLNTICVMNKGAFRYFHKTLLKYTNYKWNDSWCTLFLCQLKPLHTRVVFTFYAHISQLSLLNSKAMASKTIVRITKDLVRNLLITQPNE